MKQLIVLLASVILGIPIASLVGGPMASTVRTLWQNEVEARTMQEYTP